MSGKQKPKVAQAISEIEKKMHREAMYPEFKMNAPKSSKSLTPEQSNEADKKRFEQMLRSNDLVVNNNIIEPSEPGKKIIEKVKAVITRFNNLKEKMGYKLSDKVEFIEVSSNSSPKEKQQIQQEPEKQETEQQQLQQFMTQQTHINNLMGGPGSSNIGAQLPATNSFVAIEANATAPQSLAVQLDQAAIEHAQSIPTLGNAGYNNDSQVIQNAIELQNSTPNVDEPAQQVTAFTDTTVLPTASNYLSFGVELPPNIGVIHQQLQGPQFIGGSANSKSGGYYTLNYLGQVQEIQTPVQQIAGNVEQMLSIDYKTPAGKQVLKEQQQTFSDIQKQMLAEQKMKLAPNNKQIVNGNMRDYQLQMAGYIPNPGATKKAHMQFLKDQIPYTQQSIAVVPSLFKEDDLLITENMNRYF